MAASILISLALAAAPPGVLAPEQRIAASAAAAEALQGPLDGGWALAGPGGRTLYLFEFSDPVGGEAPLSGAWSDAQSAPGAGEIGAFDSLLRTRDRLSLSLAPGGGAGKTTILLRRGGASGWVGRMARGGAVQRVRLARTPPPRASLTAPRTVAKAAGE